jgi:DNA-directed RNA polymerase beta subunit
LTHLNRNDKGGENEELTPMLARLRDLNYEREVILKMRHQKLKWMPERGESVVVETRPVRNIKLGSFPVMVRSLWCSLLDKTPQQRI